MTLHVRRTIFPILCALGIGAVIVIAPLPLNVAASVVWLVFVFKLVNSLAVTSGGWAAADALFIQIGTMSLVILAADLAPGKTVDQVKARTITLPKQAMTLAELEDPVGHAMSRPFRYSLQAPEPLINQVVRFPSRKLTVGEFIAAIEAQTPLRHRFSHCGNGSTILNGGDCSFGVSLRVRDH